MSVTAAPVGADADARAADAVVHARPVDVERATAAVSELLDALGLDRRTDGLADTPERVARMFRELLTAAPFRPTTFPNDAGYDELVLVSDIPFTSLCEHHLLPFRGRAHVGYLPGDRIVGLSKLARLVDSFARRPQVQERLTAQVADWLRDHLEPRGVGVVIEAEHLCMSVRGVRATGARTVTSTLYGLLRERPAAREEFLQLIGLDTRRSIR
ncbi:MAG: GTP cyclohydrolase I FolE [Actinobacteria bacterium]|nr:GTP cyclohydrolase I FolE [Actinomycetota bacterium]